MEQRKREEIINNMIDINNYPIDEDKENIMLEKGKVMYYANFEFKETGLATNDIYVREIIQREKGIEDNSDIDQEEQSIIYQIYNSDKELIATVSKDGIIHFEQEYLLQLKGKYKEFFKMLKLEDREFELPEELREDDIVMTNSELREHDQNKKRKEIKKDEKEVEEETEEEKKEKTAQAIGIKPEEINSVCTINPREKITDKHNLIDIMPEAAQYEEIAIVYSKAGDKSNGYFTALGVRKDGTREKINSMESVEGATTTKDVISVNEDGSEVKEKQVKGLFRINARNRNDGISVSVGDYGMLNIDYVSNIMDKENRRATPIRTKEAQNQRISTAKVRENAGDSRDEMEKEGEIFREREDEASTQSIDGIDIDQADGNTMTLDELKEMIKEKVLDMGDMSRGQTREIIEEELYNAGLEISEQEIKMVADEIQMEVLDDSRFPDRSRNDYI